MQCLNIHTVGHTDNAFSLSHHSNADTVYRVIFMDRNFREKLDKVPRIKFHGTTGGNMNLFDGHLNLLM